MDRRRFDYVVDVPAGAHASLPWTARLRPDPDWEGQRAEYRPLPAVGLAPGVILENFDARPGVARTRVRFVARDDKDAGFKEVSFVVDRDFAGMLKPRDTLVAAVDLHGAFAVSVMREDLLVAAAGAVHCVPLGNAVKVTQPGALARQAEALFRARDPEYRIWETPVEITTETGTRLLHRGRPDLGRYEAFVVHGFIHGSECVALTCLGVCPDCAATLTAPVINAADSARWVPFKSARDVRFERDVEVLVRVENGRTHLDAGELDRAYLAAMEALIYDPDNEAARRLLDEIERRRQP